MLVPTPAKTTSDVSVSEAFLSTTAPCFQKEALEIADARSLPSAIRERLLRGNAKIAVE